MNRLILLTVAAIATIGSASPTLAGYINNKAEWNRLDDKHSYVMGVFDGLAVSTTDSKEDQAYFFGWNRCSQENGLTSLEFVQMVDQVYAEDVANWSLPPLSMMLKGLNRLCLTQLNEEREELGLPPLPEVSTRQ